MVWKIGVNDRLLGQSDRTTVGFWAPRIVAWTIVVLSLAGCALPFVSATPAVQNVIVDEQPMKAQVAALPGAPSLPAARAVAIAKQYVPTWPTASAITPEHVALTMLSNQGKVAWDLQHHPVWLVVFRGARYAPPGDPESSCACDREFQPPNTAIAIDAQSGELVIDYGFASPNSPGFTL